MILLVPLCVNKLYRNRSMPMDMVSIIQGANFLSLPREQKRQRNHVFSLLVEEEKNRAWRGKKSLSINPVIKMSVFVFCFLELFLIGFILWYIDMSILAIEFSIYWLLKKLTSKDVSWWRMSSAAGNLLITFWKFFCLLFNSFYLIMFSYLIVKYWHCHWWLMFYLFFYFFIFWGEGGIFLWFWHVLLVVTCFWL